MIIESDGSVRYGVPKESKLSTRGTKYSIPKPKGGRHDNLILREDQKEFQRPQRQQKGGGQLFGFSTIFLVFLSLRV